MAGTLGRVEEFDGTREDWPQYVERMQYFFDANGIDGAEKKRAVFLFFFFERTKKNKRKVRGKKKKKTKKQRQQ